jgi:hypothetical protein
LEGAAEMEIPASIAVVSPAMAEIYRTDRDVAATNRLTDLSTLSGLPGSSGSPTLPNSIDPPP